MKKIKKLKPEMFTSVKGMHDILPQEQWLWEKMDKAVKNIANFYNFSKIETPVVERVELFEKTTGQETDIVEKQMFTLVSKGEESMVLRPEGTPGVVRAYIQYGLSHLGQPLKLYYFGPMFRYEQPQAGRFRQFHQAGFEIIGGEEDSLYDAQVVIACYRLIEEMGINECSVQVNTIGCKNCRPAYRKKLQEYYKGKEKNLCKDCKRRLVTNPLRLLDCKEAQCQELKKEAPIILDYLCTNCSKHFKSTLEYLEEVGIPYSLNHYLVRGLDYYTGVVFEIMTTGFDFALGSGGRFNDLVELMGGKKTPAVGAAAGLERLVEVIKAREIKDSHRPRQRVFLVHVGDVAKRRSLSIIELLRKADIKVAETLGKDSLKNQLRNADKAGADLALIFGQKEAFEENIIIRDLKTGAQETVPLPKLADSIKRKLQ